MKNKPFTTDGCSGGMSWFWNNVLRRETPWRHACVVHDLQYWLGGTKDDRLHSDIRLFADVVKNGHSIIALLMFIAVRIGGSAYWPTSYRWGYRYGYLQQKYNKREKEGIEIARKICADRHIKLDF